MSRAQEVMAEKRLGSVPAALALQFEIPKLKKMIKVSMSTKSTIKQHLPLFSSKFDSDFTAFRVTARIKVGKEKWEARTDVPIRHLVAALPIDPAEQLVVIELVIAYEGG